ncbi:MAG: LysR family transcriptional regulator [Bdellovibrionales bacterium]
MLPQGSDLEYFLTITEAGSLTAASVRLGIAQPSLTLAVQRLERDMGVVLFERSQRGVKLTPAGQNVLLGVRAMKDSWQQLKDQVHDQQHQISGRVSLGCHPAVATYTLPALVLQLQKQYPAVELQLRHDLSRHLTTAVIERELDVGLVINPLRHPDLVIRSLLHDEVGFWVAKDFQFKSIDQHPLIADPDLLQVQTLLRRVGGKRLRFRPLLATSQLEVVASLTLAGAGIGILPHRVAMALGRKGLRPLKEFPTFRDELCLIYRPERRTRPVVKALLNLITNTHS